YPFVQHSQLFILTSYWEGLPIAVLEAMCLGKTLVLTDCSSAVREIMLGSDEDIDWARRDEAIRTDYGYMLQNPGETKNLLNYDLWERAINTILVDEKLRRECEKAAKVYAQYHDISILEERWENLFAR
ncbi:TPA: hypothetical protein DHW51_06610, partial [Candidatus Poribacteria bacterium]|nr:hypothetical protein [Candidatus Poribacteria bacterium]